MRNEVSACRQTNTSQKRNNPSGAEKRKKKKLEEEKKQQDKGKFAYYNIIIFLITINQAFGSVCAG